MDNCIRCHTQLNTEFVKTGKIDYMQAKRGEGKACWDCHREVAHGGMNTLSRTPNAENASAYTSISCTTMVAEFTRKKIKI